MNNEPFMYIIQCRNDDVILDLPWLCNANPIVNWATGTGELPDSKLSQPLEDAEIQWYLICCNGLYEHKSNLEKLEERNTLLECVGCTTISTSLAANKEKEVVVLCPEFSDFTNVFKKPKVSLFPHCPFDHIIELDDFFVPY